METVLLKFCSKISSSLVSFLPPAILNELARKKDVDAWDRALNKKSLSTLSVDRPVGNRGASRTWPGENSRPADLARVVFENLNDNDTKQKFPRWFQGVFTEISLIATEPYLGFCKGGTGHTMGHYHECRRHEPFRGILPQKIFKLEAPKRYFTFSALVMRYVYE